MILKGKRNKMGKVEDMGVISQGREKIQWENA
jgi:hypothetical protein